MTMDPAEREQRYWNDIYDLWHKRLSANTGWFRLREGCEPTAYDIDHQAVQLADRAVLTARHYGYPLGW